MYHRLYIIDFIESDALMKKFIAIVLFICCFACCFVACEKNPVSNPTATPNENEPTGSASELPIGDPDVTPSPTPDASVVTKQPTPTPVPTPPPAAQKDSIVPSYLLTTGYTTPLGDVPAGYNMPYYIEVDLTNQCVNVFVKNDATGKYDILLNRFVCSGGTTDMPTKQGSFYIKSKEQQIASTGQYVNYTSYYFKKYESYAYYITRYSNAYMFHSYTFYELNGLIRVKSYNLGNPGSAGCLRMLMNHAKWIHDNAYAGTYVVVNAKRKSDAALKKALKKLPPLGYDMTKDFDPQTNAGIVKTIFPTINGMQVYIPGVTDVTATPTIKPTPTITPTPTPTPFVTPTATPTATPTNIPVIVPTVTPFVTPTVTTTVTPLMSRR